LKYDACTAMARGEGAGQSGGGLVLIFTTLDITCIAVVTSFEDDGIVFLFTTAY